jgi:putative ABC transport system permease protein
VGQDYLPIRGGYGIDVAVMLWGVALGGCVAAGFSAIAVCEVHGQQPAAVARGDNSTAGGRWRVLLMMLVVIAGTVVVAAYETRSWRIGPVVIGLLVLGAIGTAIIGWPLLRLPSLILNFWHGRWSVGIRHGLRNLTRPGFRPLSAIVAIAAAMMLMAAMAVYRVSLSDELTGGNAQRPGTFCIDVQDDQVDDFRAWVTTTYAVEPSLSQMVLGRLRTINGVPPKSSRTDTRENERRTFMRGREQRLSWRKELGADETIIAGEFMDNDSTRVEASLEQRFAGSIGAKMGDVLAFDIQGVTLEATVTSIRSVQWANMRPNFFILLSPHALRDAPGSWVASIPALPPAQQRQVIGTMAQRFPSIMAFDVAEISSKLHEMLQRISLAVTFLGWFCLGAGILVLIGIGIGTARARRSDAALLSVLGGQPVVLFSSIAAEFASLALIAGVIGTAFGSLFAYTMLRIFIELPVIIPWPDLALLLATTVAVGVLAGLFACRHVFTVRPLVVLRDE